MIHLITSFYITHFNSEKNNDRNNELQTALNNNLFNPLIDKVHLYIDNNEALEYIQNLNNSKIIIISINYKPLYSDFFNYANTNLSEHICMITNSDIYLHECDINILNKLNDSNMVYALTRHENDLSCVQIQHFVGSHDSFLFKSPVNIDINDITHPQDVWGAENVICYELKKKNIPIKNPCYQIKIVHLHSSWLRNSNRIRINQTRSSSCRPEIIEKISVIIPTYNNFASLLNTINSIKKQTYINIEIIVVNNCSTEKEYYNYDWSKNDIIHLKEVLTNKGDFYNLGIDVSTGKYIAFCKDTDIWFPKKLELQQNEMIKTNCKMSSTDGLIGNGVYDSNKIYKKYNAEYYYEKLKNIYKKKGSPHLDKGFPKIWNLDFLKIHNCIINSSVIIHRDIINKTGKFVSSKGEEYNYWLRVLEHTNNVYLHDICFYYKL